MQAHEIIYDLLTNYCAIDPVYIDFDAWQTEADDHLIYNYSAIICTPEGVTTLLDEICEQMYVSKDSYFLLICQLLFRFCSKN